MNDERILDLEVIIFCRGWLGGHRAITMKVCPNLAIRDLVPEQVAKYIEDNGLYQEDKNVSPFIPILTIDGLVSQNLPGFMFKAS